MNGYLHSSRIKTLGVLEGSLEEEKDLNVGRKNEYG